MEHVDFTKEVKAMMNQGFQVTDSLFDMFVQTQQHGDERMRQWTQWGLETSLAMARPLSGAAQNLHAAIKDRLGDTLTAMTGLEHLPTLMSGMEEGVRKAGDMALEGIRRMTESSIGVTRMAREFHQKMGSNLHLDA